MVFKFHRMWCLLGSFGQLSDFTCSELWIGSSISLHCSVLFIFCNFYLKCWWRFIQVICGAFLCTAVKCCIVPQLISASGWVAVWTGHTENNLFSICLSNVLLLCSAEQASGLHSANKLLGCLMVGVLWLFVQLLKKSFEGTVFFRFNYLCSKVNAIFIWPFRTSRKQWNVCSWTRVLAKHSFQMFHYITDIFIVECKS